MTTAFWCVLIAGLLPYAAAFIAKNRKDFDNTDPRGWLAKQTGIHARAHAAQLNSFEAFPLFAAAVIIAHLRGAPQETINLLAIGFVAARIVYLGMYLASLPALRSTAWFAGMLCAVPMFFVGP